MNLSVSKDELYELAYLANSIVERKTTMPILVNIKLVAEEEKLTVYATSLEVSLSGEISAKIKTPGTVVLPGRNFYEIVKELPDGVVDLKVTPASNRMEISAGPANFKVNTISADEFPTVKGVELHSPVTVSTKVLLEMLDATSFAASDDKQRHSINGVCIERVPGSHKQDHMVRMVATDGHRLAAIDRKIVGLDVSESKIIPKKCLSELRKSLEGFTGESLVSFFDGFITVKSGGITIGTVLINGEFPDYTEILPKRIGTSARVDRAEFVAAVRRVSIVSPEDSRILKMVVRDNEMVLSSGRADFGEGQEILPVTFEGEPIAIGFSAFYIADLLSAMPKSDEVLIKLDGTAAPVLFQSPSDDHYLGVIMPMRF